MRAAVMPSPASPRDLAREAWLAGVAAVQPGLRVRAALDARPDLVADPAPGLVVAIGKAGAGMLAAALEFFGDKGLLPRRAIALVPEDADASLLPPGVAVLRGGHPLPSSRGVVASRRIVHAARQLGQLGKGQHMLVLLSGGASALFEVPAAGLTTDDVIDAYRALVPSGLVIDEINTVRSCLSAVKAGRFAEAARPARVTTLAISDVDGDEPAVIGSGPTVDAAAPPIAMCRRALELVHGAAVTLPERAMELLERGARGSRRRDQSRASAWPLTDPSHDEVDDFTVIASVAMAAEAAREHLRRAGCRVDRDRGQLGGRTGAAAARIVRVLREAEGRGRSGAGESGAESGTCETEGRAGAAEGSADEAERRAGDRAAPFAAVFGGESIVAVPAGAPTGRGGRNLDLAARLALQLAGWSRLAVAVGGTDGCDGSSRAAGAVIDGGSAARAEAAGLPLADAVAAFDTEPALEAAGDLLVTGPTGTNVGDLVVAVRQL